jgi:endonuclease III
MKANNAKKIIALLKKEYPEAKSALNFSNPFQLLIATILSAQCTDERVNIITKDIFAKYKTPADFDKVKVEELEKNIFSAGFYKQKAKNIKLCCNKIVNDYDGKMTKDFDLLTELPGVGRKTASVVMGNGYGVPAIAVDTHVKRLSNLLGLTESDNPDKIELDLKDALPPEDWVISSHLLATHGRKVCNAKKPKCDICVLSKLCPSVNYKL